MKKPMGDKYNPIIQARRWLGSSPCYPSAKAKPASLGHCNELLFRLPSESPLCPTWVPDGECAFHQTFKGQGRSLSFAQLVKRLTAFTCPKATFSLYTILWLSLGACPSYKKPHLSKSHTAWSSPSCYGLAKAIAQGIFLLLLRLD